MMRSVACTAAVAAAVAVLTGAATATANDVAASAKQYGHSSCYQQKYKCGEDYSKCTYEYGVCVQFGCHKDVSYSCPYEAREKYDCLKKVDETYTVTERKSYQDTQWVKGGCEKDGKIKYDCNKTYDEACKKQREVSFRCTKTRTVDCQKEKDATCTRRKYKQCFHPSKTESYPCTKYYKKEVYCSNGSSYGYDGKKCYENIAYQGTCTKQVGGGSYDCSYDESYPCKKKYDAKCEQSFDALCKRTETYDAKCSVTKWVGGGCEKDGKVKYDCNVTTTKYYDEQVQKTRTVSKWVPGGCERTVTKPNTCTKREWDSKCCAKKEDKKTCEDKYCTKTVCN